jgi:hypothetical protein
MHLDGTGVAAYRVEEQYMKKLVVLVVALALTSACARDSASLEIKPGSTVSVEKKDGVIVAGRLVEVKPEHVVVETAGGRKEIARADIASLRADTAVTTAPALPAAAPSSASSLARPGSTPGSERPVGSAGTASTAASDPRPAAAEYREVTLPAGTILPVELTTAVASDSSNVEDAVRGTLRRAVTAGGVQAFPVGTAVSGVVTSVERSGRVKGRAEVAFRFSTIDPPGDAERLSMRTDTIARQAQATKKTDAAKIGGGAAGGAIIGGILGGGDGAAKGAAIGGAAGTGVVLGTRGKEIRLGPGTPVSVRLSAPLTVRVRVAS